MCDLTLSQKYRDFSLANQYRNEPCLALVYPDGEVLYIPPVDIKVMLLTTTPTIMTMILVVILVVVLVTTLEDIDVTLRFSVATFLLPPVQW